VAREERRAFEGDARDGELDGELAPIGTHSRDLDPAAQDVALAALHVAREASPMSRTQLRRHDQIRHVPSRHRVRRIAEDSLRRRVERDDSALVIHRDHCVEGGIERRAQARLALPHRALGGTVLDEAPDLAPEALESLQELRVGACGGGGHHLDDGDRFAVPDDGEAERGAKARL
jgi:hypothetical protein